MKESLLPLGIHVLIEPVDRQAGKGFRVHGKAEGVPDRGILRAVGEGVESEVLKGAIGKTVFYRQHAEEKFLVGDTSYHLVEDVDVMGIYENQGK